MSYLKINGVEMPTPLPYTSMISDLDSDKSSRNAKGRLYRDRIAIKSEVEWGILTDAECKKILNAVAAQEFTVEFFDAQKGNATCTMYAGDRSPQIIQTSSGIFWRGLKFSLIEC